MAVINLITIAEADVFNALSSDWLALTDPEKSAYVFNASLYMQSYWSCADIEWDDETTLTEDQKRACAYYAEANRLDLLFTPLEQVEAHGRVVEETNKVGSLVETTKWSGYGSETSGDPLQSIDALMMLDCSRSGTGSTELIRV